MNLIARALRRRPDRIRSLVEGRGPGDLVSLLQVERTLDSKLPAVPFETSSGVGGLWTFNQQEWGAALDVLAATESDAPLTHWIELMSAGPGEVGLLVPDDSFVDENWSFAARRGDQWRVVSVPAEESVRGAEPDDRAPCDLDPRTGQCVNYDCDAECEHSSGQTPFGQRVPCCICAGKRPHIGFAAWLRDMATPAKMPREPVYE
jgi:hypothetical protein